MNKLIILLTSLIFSVSSFAATEITKSEAIERNLTKIGTINKTDSIVALCSNKISKEADNQGAEYYVITAITSQGNGNAIVITSDLYK